jgi:hypothetical protein
VGRGKMRANPSPILRSTFKNTTLVGFRTSLK